MITLYTSPSCTSCRKAKAWFEKQGLEYVERNIFKDPFTVEEIKSIIRLTEEGTQEIISERSKVFQQLNIDLDDLTLNELYKLIIEQPGILKRPIILDEKRVQIGFNDDEIRSFLPRKVRELQIQNILKAVN
jgi:regulatory protein spx